MILLSFNFDYILLSQSESEELASQQDNICSKGFECRNSGDGSKQSNFCVSSSCINDGANNQNICGHDATCNNSGTNTRVISMGDICENKGTNTQVICLHGRVINRPN